MLDFWRPPWEKTGSRRGRKLATTGGKGEFGILGRKGETGDGSRGEAGERRGFGSGGREEADEWSGASGTRQGASGAVGGHFGKVEKSRNVKKFVRGSLQRLTFRNRGSTSKQLVPC